MKTFLSRYARVLLAVPALALAALAAAHGFDAHASVAGCTWDGNGTCLQFVHLMR